jgi:acyl dehydratase
MRFYADLAPGTVLNLGSVCLTETSIVDFARQYDPQPIHVERVQAENSSFGGIIASGWQVGGSFMRLLVDGLLSDVAGAGGPGVDSMRLYRPVRPGDRLHARVTIADKRPSRNPDQGTVVFEGEMRNDDDELVMTVRIFGRVLLRDPQTALT